MAAAKEPRCCEHFRPTTLQAWPGPASVSGMEILAREDIDRAVHTILFRENHMVKRLDTYLQHLDIFKTRRKEMLYKKWVENAAEPLQRRITEKITSYRGIEKTKEENFEHYLKHTNKTVTVPPFAGPLFRRQQEAVKEKRSGPEDGTGKPYSTKECKETAKTSLHTKPSRFPFAVHSWPPREWSKTSLRSMGSRMHSTCSPQHLPCAGKKPGEEETCDPSQAVYERQFRSSRLGRETPCAAKVLGVQQQRPRSWAAGDHRQGRGPPPVERRVMMAEVLGKHLASLQEAARPPPAFYRT